jgi:hypothetical protein
VFFQELIVDADRRRHHFAMTIAQHIYHFTNHVVDTPEVIPSEVEEAVRTLVRWAGDDPDREGLIETPKRVARAWREYCKGYEEDAATRCSAFNFSILLCFTSRTPCAVQRQAVACARAARKSETYRSLRSLQVAAQVPSAGTITLQVELRSARVPSAPVSVAACGARPSHRKGKSHASSFNSAGRVADSSPTRNSYRRGRVDGYRVFLGRLDDWRHRHQTCG